jgi:NarL family two-component system sensor histidine kinase LiaS
MVGALPIFDEFGKERVVGIVVFMQKMGIWEVWTFAQIAKQVAASLLFITLFAGVMGTVFGSLTSRDFVQRLSGLFASARAWSQGDFSVSVDDTEGDELGQLAQGLNDMASQLENLLEDRQRISVMEERNRLARDLHDSVKQQAFAASAQLAAAQVHIGPDPQEAFVNLSKAQKLLLGVRQELTDLILELRPLALQGRGLATAIREYARDCACQSQIDIEVNVQGHRPLPLQVEQSLFRIVQGALANVVRHSQASQAKIELTYEPTTIRLAISDNGKGFCADEWQSGLGLSSIRERAELIGGCMLIDSKLGAGTKIMVKCNY